MEIIFVIPFLFKALGTNIHAGDLGSDRIVFFIGIGKVDVVIEGEKFTWNPKGIPYVEDNMRWRAWQMVDLRFTKRLFKFKGIEPVFYIDVFNLFDTKNMIMPDIDYVSSTDTRIDEASSDWVWDPGGYWKNEFVEYMNSLDLDGGDKPGDWKGDHIKLPHSTFWTFLNKRDIFFGIRINFD